MITLSMQAKQSIKLVIYFNADLTGLPQDKHSYVNTLSFCFFNVKYPKADLKTQM